ncbi:hypothetical protein [Halobaculum litoreum]|uniref:PH domain-containing protein n=1 Tax=Halobaculum litoreum TaxID=3031998 RepID=A0ABD5XVE2_9EURY|nr:hypothetical protein [Halobaculum sp. DT92]
MALGATAPGTPAAWVALAGVASCLPAMAALWLAETETSRRRIDDATVHVRFGGDGPGRTALAGAAVAAIGAVGLAAAGLFDLFGDGVGTALFTSVATLVTAGSTVLSAAGDDEGGNEDDRDADGTDADDAPRAAVTDAGVRIGERFHGWETLEGYRVTDEEVEIRRDTWLHPTLSFERDDPDDVAAVVDALGRHLPRVDDEGRVETAAAPGHGRGLRDAAEATGGERESAAGRERERAE